MDLSKENPEDNQVESENPQAIAQLNGLLDLLADLKIIHQTEFASLESELSSEGKNKELEDWQNLLQVPKVLALPPAKDVPISNEQQIENLVPLVESQENKQQSSQISEEQATELLSLLLFSNQDSGDRGDLIPLDPPSEKTSETTEIAEEKAQEKELDDSFQRLQNLLVGPEMNEVRDLVAYVDEKVAQLEHQIYEPTELINLLLPWIAELLSRKVSESQEDVVQAIAPIIDKVIENRTDQDRAAMSAALAPLISAAISQQIRKSPEEIAVAIAPTMGKAIKEQITIERDAMVDALYPVIGSTVAKYIAEAIREINQKITEAISPHGFLRKVRARVYGVSEGELVFQESFPLIVQAIFLIHKTSGLVISEVQQSGEHRLESDMLAGMLTAIRSFVNDCIAQSGTVSELDAIEYGTSQIMLEVAGYCYLAVVIQGTPTKRFIKKMRLTMETIVLKYGKSIESFDGDSSTIPAAVPSLLSGLMERFATKQQASKPPYALLGLSLGILSLILVPWGIYLYRNTIERRVEAKTVQALASAPDLAVYRLNVEADGDSLRLSGKVPNQYLRQKAEQIAASAAPNLKLYNEIITVEVPPDPVSTAAEVKRVTSILNQKQGVVISARYDAGQVTVAGKVPSLADIKQITQAYQQIPGVKSVLSNSLRSQPSQPLKIATRIYFDRGSASLNPENSNEKINQVKAFLNKYPDQQLKIVGYSDPSGTLPENQRLSLERAKAVWYALVSKGIDPKRLQMTGTVNPPLNIDPYKTPDLSRVVEFEPITSVQNSQ